MNSHSPDCHFVVIALLCQLSVGLGGFVFSGSPKSGLG